MRFGDRFGLGRGSRYAAAMRSHVAFALCAAAFAVCLLASGCATHAPLTQQRQAFAESFDGSRIAYGQRGRGEPVIVFIHGWLCNREMWRPQIDYFSNKYRVVWLDLAGHGDSESARDAYSIAAFGRDVQAVADAVPQGPVILVGHSMGGNVSIEAARLLGDRVAAIVTVDTFLTPLSRIPTQKKLQFVGWLAKDYPAALKATVESMFPQGVSPALVQSTYEAMSVPDRRVGVEALRANILWNERETSAGLREFAHMLHHINAGEPGEEPAADNVTLIPGTGHFVALVAPEAFNGVLEGIIEDSMAH